MRRSHEHPADPFILPPPGALVPLKIDEQEDEKQQEVLTAYVRATIEWIIFT